MTINSEQDLNQGVYRYPDGYLDLQRQADGTWRCHRYDTEYRCHWVDQISQPAFNIRRAAAAIAFSTGYAGPLQQVDRGTFLQQRDEHRKQQTKTVDKPHRRIHH